jgi:hypothetical protein
MLEVVEAARERLQSVLEGSGRADDYWEGLRHFLSGEVRERERARIFYRSSGSLERVCV